MAKKRPLHSVDNLHLISTLVGLLDDIVDNTVLPKNSRVCPLVFSKFGESKQARQDLTVYDLENQLKEQLKQAIESGQLIS